MPHITSEVVEIMNLHQRCKNYNALPCAGNLLDQPVWLMDLFDAIDSTVAAIRNKQVEEQVQEVKSPRLHARR